jgi:hypothetical protein
MRFQALFTGLYLLGSAVASPPRIGKSILPADRSEWVPKETAKRFTVPKPCVWVLIALDKHPQILDSVPTECKFHAHYIADKLLTLDDLQVVEAAAKINAETAEKIKAEMAKIIAAATAVKIDGATGAVGKPKEGQASKPANSTQSIVKPLPGLPYSEIQNMPKECHDIAYVVLANDLTPEFIPLYCLESLASKPVTGDTGINIGGQAAQPPTENTGINIGGQAFRPPPSVRPIAFPGLPHLQTENMPKECVDIARIVLAYGLPRENIPLHCLPAVSVLLHSNQQTWSMPPYQ